MAKSMARRSGTRLNVLRIMFCSSCMIFLYIGKVGTGGFRRVARRLQMFRVVTTCWPIHHD